MSDRPLRLVSRPVVVAAIVIVCLAAGVVVLATSGGRSASAPQPTGPTVDVGGTAHGWVFHDGQTVTVSMGPNKLFVPHQHVNILECADPGGTKANLPTRFGNCDENSIQSDTVLVGPGGTFSESAYTVFRLPSRALGEQSNWQPVCDRTHPCVLLISEYQTDFLKPKAFSHSFVVLPATGSATGP